MMEFLRKFKNLGIKIATKSINLQLFTFIFYGFGGP